MGLVGSVGIIFEPFVENVLTVDNCDSGSSDYGSGGKSLTIDSFHRSFQVADGKYNEWWIIGAEVRGIFVCNPDCIWTRQVIPLVVDGYECEQIIHAERTTPNKVIEAFPEFSVFTMGPDGPEVISWR